MQSIKFTTIDEYHSQFTPEIQSVLKSIRKAIKQAAPKAAEVISYNMPAFKQNDVLVYYAANKNHIGFYPTAKPIEVFKEDLKDYTTSKGAIQFSLAKKLPIALIKKITKYRVEEDWLKLKNKKK
jgi:uncharacterized protein YdhG (YjbR/CyaY superfamily)